MKLRLQGLSDVDPLRVPLPHGTEVTTRVDRAVEGRTVPRGALGRVRAVDDAGVTVRIVGVGDVRYARDELVPHKVGQVEFALRREGAWQALRPNVVIETVVGSRAWGLADEGSDTDVRGVFVLPAPWTFALVDAPADLVSADGSETYWEVDKALRQGVRADPNTLETLLLPDARATDAIGEWILAERDALVSVEIYGTFGRYALSQLKRLRQSLRLAEHRALLLGWLADDPTLDLDRIAARLADAALEEGAPDPRARAREYVKQLYSSLFDQGLLASRDYAGLVAFAAAGGRDFELPRELRPKNAYNLLRLLATATRWLRSGRPEFALAGPLRDELIAIKRQAIDLGRVIARAEELAVELEEARRVSPLPARADVGRVDRLLRRVREEAARRWVAREVGPFGRDAAILPLAEWA